MLAAFAPHAQPPGPAGPAEPADLTLTLINEGGADYVVMQRLLGVIQHFFPDAQGGFDPLREIMRIEANGKRIEVYARRALINIDGRQAGTARPLLIREGRVLVPEPTVLHLLEELRIDVTQDEPTPQPAAPAGPSIPTGLLGPQATPIPTPIPTPPSEPTPPLTEPDPTPIATPQPDTPPEPAVAVMPSLPRTQSPIAEPSTQLELQPPPSLTGSLGLSWSQLADLAHRELPRRILLTCDQPLEEAARRAAERIEQRLIGAVCRVMVIAPAMRTHSTTISDIESWRPQLAIDLTALPADQNAESTPLAVWVVSSALWPDEERHPGGGDPAASRYRAHEFHSLALGSLLRAELARQYSQSPINYELAPSYLLRRVDAPSTALLMPVPDGLLDADRFDTLARALADAVAGYSAGMEQVRF